jgi:2-dehydropantoate 2-reductase
VVFTGIFLEPGVVHNPVRGNAGVLEVGRFPQGLDDLTADLEAALTQASFATWANPDIMGAKGAKLLGNLGNALGAITDGQGDSRAFMAGVRREAESALKAGGVRWEPRESFDARMKQNRGTNELPEGVRNLGSTWQSLMRGTGDVEADYLNGEIVRLGRVFGIETPHNAVLQELSNQMAAQGEKPGRYTAQDLEELVRSRK